MIISNTEINCNFSYSPHIIVHIYNEIIKIKYETMNIHEKHLTGVSAPSFTLAYKAYP